MLVWFGIGWRCVGAIDGMFVIVFVVFGVFDFVVGSGSGGGSDELLLS